MEVSRDLFLCDEFGPFVSVVGTSVTVSVGRTLAH